MNDGLEDHIHQRVHDAFTLYCTGLLLSKTGKAKTKL